MAAAIISHREYKRTGKSGRGRGYVAANMRVRNLRCPVTGPSRADEKDETPVKDVETLRNYG